MKKFAFLLLGTTFGFLLSRAGATTYDFYAGLFLFQNFQLLWIIAVAAGVGIVGIVILKKLRTKSVFENDMIDFKRKPYKKTLIPGSIIFGMGWGLAAACPGTVLAMLGEGKLGALFTIAGALLGTYLHGLQENRALKAKHKEAATASS